MSNERIPSACSSSLPSSLLPSPRRPLFLPLLLVTFLVAVTLVEFPFLRPFTTLLLVSADTAVSTLPDPIYATWTTLTQAPSPTDGFPATRCDHSFKSLTGLSQRTNDAFPKPASLTGDPYAHKLWLYGGLQDKGFSDTWLLDVGVTPPQWELISYTPTSGLPIQGRWGTAVTFIPNGIHPSDSGLTAVIYGGYSDSQYLSDVATFNFGNNVFRELVTSSASMSSDAPFQRSYVELMQLPKGSGTGSADAIDVNVDSGIFFTQGGMGASDGVQNSASDKDWNDEWLLELPNMKSGGNGVPWKQVGSTVCLRNVTTCTDSVVISSLIQQFTNSSAYASIVDVNASIRPSELFDTLQSMLSAISAQNIDRNSYVDQPGACSTSCVEFAPQESVLTPPVNEGARMARMGKNVYLFGGYGCSERGQQTKGGLDCFYNSMYILNLATMTWREIPQPSSDSPWFKYHPSRRAYHTMVAVPERNIIVVIGGAFQENGGDFFFYNDAYAFDTVLERFVPFQTLGIPPKVHWSAAAAYEEDKVYLFGGCQGIDYLTDLTVLQVGLKVGPDNCYASGSGLTSATAGEPTTFYIQTREFERMRVSNDSNTTQIVWGNNATYGSGLTFTAQLVSVSDSSSSSSSSLSLVQTKVVEVGLGLYQVTYTATVGSAYEIFVYYSNFDQNLPIPGSPFSLTLQPKSVAAPDQSTVSGYGSRVTVQGQRSTFSMQMRDNYANPFKDDRFLQQQTDTASVMSSSKIAVPNSQQKSGELLGNLTATGGAAFTSITGDALQIMASLGSTPDEASAALEPVPSLSVVNTQDGRFVISYDAPKGMSTFYLSVTVNGVPVSGSPFQVNSLTPLALSQGSIIAFRFLSAFCMLLCILSGLCVFHYRAEAVMRSSSPNFLYLLVVGGCLSSLSVVFLTIEGSDQACQTFHSLLSIGFVTTLTSLLVKSHRVSAIFNAKQFKVATNLRDSTLLIPTAAVIIFMTVLNIIWIGVNPMRSVRRPADNEFSDVLSYQSCSGAYSDRWSGSLLACCGLLLLYGVYLAIQTGQVPENYNESKVIAASVYNAFFCCIVVVPLMFFLNTSAFLQGRLVIMSLAILWCSLFNVLALILPKLLVIKNVISRDPTSHTRVNEGGNVSHTGAAVAGKSYVPGESNHSRRFSARGSFVGGTATPGGVDRIQISAWQPAHSRSAASSNHSHAPSSHAPSSNQDPHHLQPGRPPVSTNSRRSGRFGHQKIAPERAAPVSTTPAASSADSTRPSIQGGDASPVDVVTTLETSGQGSCVNGVDGEYVLTEVQSLQEHDAGTSPQLIARESDAFSMPNSPTNLSQTDPSATS